MAGARQTLRPNADTSLPCAHGSRSLPPGRKVAEDGRPHRGFVSEEAIGEDPATVLKLGAQTWLSTAAFDIDEDALAVGAGMMVWGR